MPSPTIARRKGFYHEVKAGRGVERMQRRLGIRDGHMYAPRLMAASPGDGSCAVRVSLVHYNTPDEMHRFGAALMKISSGL